MVTKQLINDSITIADAMENINNGTYVLPTFQRDFVWTKDKIEKLWDSIMQGYPISTFLFWSISSQNVTDKVFFYTLHSTVNYNAKGKIENKNYDEREVYYDKSKEYIAVLDGQQRLTALYLSLYGTVECSGFKYDLLIELDQNKIFINDVTNEDENSEIDDINQQYDIRFLLDENDRSSSQFLLRNILQKKFKSAESREFAINQTLNEMHIPENSHQYARDILNTLCNKIYGTDNAKNNLINYTLTQYFPQEDALQIFIRLNSFGVKLPKATIIKSTIAARWKDANSKFAALLKDDFKFKNGEDFIVRTAHMLWGDVVKAPIEDYDVIRNLKEEWDTICVILRNLHDILLKHNIQMQYFQNRWNILIPVIYSMYHNYNYQENIDDIIAYLMRAVLLGYFRNGTPGKLNKLKEIIKRSNGYKIDIKKIETNEPELQITPEKFNNILELDYGRTTSTDALYFLSLDWNTGKQNYKRHKDHLHAKKYFNRMNPPLSIISQENWIKWRGMYNKLPNLQFLEAAYNEEKKDKPLDDWFGRCSEDEKKRFKCHGYIPDVDLSLQNFDEFYKERKKLLSAKFEKLLKYDLPKPENINDL